MSSFCPGRYAHSMCYATVLSLEEMDEIKIGLHFVDCVDQEYNYTAYLQ